MQRVHTAIFLEKKRVINELKELTRAKTIKHLMEIIPLWDKYATTTAPGNFPILSDKECERVYDELGMQGGWTRIKIGATLKKFSWKYGQLKYVLEMEKAHDEAWKLIPFFGHEGSGYQPEAPNP